MGKGKEIFKRTKKKFRALFKDLAPEKSFSCSFAQKDTLYIGISLFLQSSELCFLFLIKKLSEGL